MGGGPAGIRLSTRTFRPTLFSWKTLPRDFHTPREQGWGGVGAEVSGQSEASATGWEPPTAGVMAPQDRLAVATR